MALALQQVVSHAVDDVVNGTPELHSRPALAAKIRERMTGVSLAAAELIAHERDLSRDIDSRAERPKQTALAEGLAAGDANKQTAVKSAGDVLRSVRDAIDFPTFVSSLISGVFQAIQNSNIQQLQAFADLMDAVGQSTSDFATSQIGGARAAEWAASRFGVFTIEKSDDSVELMLRDEAEMPSMEQLRSALGATDAELRTIDADSLSETLLPLVQRKLARDRQAMLSTMVLMGLQRIVVDDGALHASMRLQVDARSIAEQQKAEKLDTRVSTEASGSFGVGAWGASAKLSATVGYVKAEEETSKEDIAVSAGLRSSVDLRFRSLPLDTRRIANDRTIDQLRSKSMSPDAEKEIAPGGLLTDSKRTPGEFLQKATAGTTPPPANTPAPEPPKPAAKPEKKEEPKKTEPKKTDGEKAKPKADEAKKEEPKKTDGEKTKAADPKKPTETKEPGKPAEKVADEKGGDAPVEGASYGSRAEAAHLPRIGPVPSERHLPWAVAPHRAHFEQRNQGDKPR